MDAVGFRVVFVLGLLLAIHSGAIIYGDGL